MNELRSKRELMEIIKDQKKFDEELLRRTKKIDAELGPFEKSRKKDSLPTERLSPSSL